MNELKGDVTMVKIFRDFVVVAAVTIENLEIMVNTLIECTLSYLVYAGM